MKSIAPISAAGLVRAALVELARNSLPPDEPEVLRAVAGLAWRVELLSRRRRADALLAAARACFGANVRTAETLVREAHDVDLQRRLEELLLGRLEPRWVGRYVDLFGLQPNDPPTLFVALNGPHPLMGLRALVSARPGLVAVHDDGAPDSPRAADRWLHRRFTELRRRVPVLWEPDLGAVEHSLHEGRDVHLTLEPTRPIATIDAALAEGTVLGRPLIDATRGRPVRAVLVHRERDKRWRVEVTPELEIDAAVAALAAHVHRWPGQFLPWCLTP